MKSLKNTICLLLVALLAMGSVACGGKKEPTEPEYVIGDAKVQDTLYICSDLHLLSNDVIPDPSIKASYTSDGRVQAADYELVDALVAKVNADRPTALILTGDLSYNGEKESHEVLVQKLNQIDKSVKVLVIPGNHDTYILNGLVKDSSTTDEIFRALYADYGYTGAISYDPDTLSYAYQLSDDLVALMIDTTLCRYNEEEGRNTVGGFIAYDTLAWMENVIIEAQKKGQRVITFTHHNVVDHDTGFTSGYTLIDNETVIELLMKYNIKLNFSGHLHIQNIAKTTADGKTLYDVASSSLLTYGNSIGRLDIYPDGFVYAKDRLVPYENFTEMSKNHFMDVYYDKNIAKFNERYGSQGDAVLRFTCLCNVLYFDGDYEAVMEQRTKDKKLLQQIKNKSTGNLSHYFRITGVDQRFLSGYWQ